MNSALSCISSERGRESPGDRMVLIRPGWGDITTHAVCEVDGFGNVVGDEQDGFAFAAPQLEQIILQLRASEFVERAERFVHEKDRRVPRQRPYDRHPLLHAARQLVRIGVLEFQQPD